MINSRFSLQDRTALVTGASSGLGWNFAKVLAKAGAAVIVTARRKDRLDILVKEIEADGGKALAIPLDVTNGGSISAVFDQSEATFGVIDLLINNAGIGDPQPFISMDETSWDTMMEVNLKSVWRISQEASKRLIAAKKEGSIINIASILGLRVAHQLSHYATAKAGVVQLTKALSLELAKHNIRVNALAPGYFLTEINEEFFSTEQGQNFIQRRVPMRRLGKVDELSGPLLLLASDAGSFMTGSIINVDGGHLNNSL
ncbi:MAG TPA: glucose 1-dehydrogenase [Alcanivoracaceae bacterium]|nr:glucose 1-dehydrogenase [Alcanivoracaceae bacterium]